MKIEYELNEKDVAGLLSFQYGNTLFVTRIKTMAKLFLLGLFFTGGLIAIGGMIISVDVGGQYYWLFNGLEFIFASAYFGLYYLFMKGMMFLFTKFSLVKTARKKYPDRLGPHGLEVLDDGLAEYSPGRTLQLKWRRIKKAALKKDHLFIFQDASPEIVVPLDAFEGRDERDRFLAKLLTKSRLRLEGRRAGSGYRAAGPG